MDITSGKGTRGTSNSGKFVPKLYNILEDPSHKHIVRWGENGESFVIVEVEKFMKTVLPKHFNHGNFATFVRQLNKYNFHRVRQDNADSNPSPYGQDSWEFRHPDFHLNKKDSLKNIRKRELAPQKLIQSNCTTPWIKYKYENLQGDRSIRLLSLLPGSDAADPLRCQLEIYSLTNDCQIPQYAALSYVWGDPTSDFHIQCEGRTLPITRNLFQALHRIRDLQRDSNHDLTFSQYLWVDAICINQNDDKEKSAQIQLIGDIFNSAQTVICWIGDSNGQENIHSSNRLGKQSTPEWQYFNKYSQGLANSKLGKSTFGADVNRSEGVLRRVSESKYWTRAWTFQEALMSKRRLVFSGTDVVEWESVGDLLQEATTMRDVNFDRLLPKAIHFHTLTTTSPMVHLLLQGRPASVAQKLDKTFTRSLSLELSRILSFLTQLNTSDPRDKIYALGGLMAAMDIKVRVDYFRPISSVCGDIISDYSKRSWSFSKWAMKPRDSSSDQVLPNIFDATITAARRRNISQMSKQKAEQAMHQPHSTTHITSIIETPVAVKQEIGSSQHGELDRLEEVDSTTSRMSSPSTGVEEVGYTSFVQSLTNIVLARSQKWLISRASTLSGPVLNQCGPHEKGAQDQQVSTIAERQTTSNDKIFKQQGSKFQGIRRGRDDLSDNEGDQERAKKKPKGTTDFMKLLACPFFQRNPQGPSMHRSCSGPGWVSIPRLKEHLYRTHFAHRCRRCRTRFEAACELESHYQNPIPCKAASFITDPMEGFSESQRDSLKCRRTRNWKQIYLILFPDDDERFIPSEYYSSAIAMADVLDQFEQHYRCEAEQLLASRLEPILDSCSSRSRTNLQNDILETISDIHNTVIQSFRERMTSINIQNCLPTPRRDPMVEISSRIEPDLDNPASYFWEYLNNISNDNSISQSLSTNTGFDSIGFLSSSTYDQPIRSDHSIRLGQAQSSPRSQDGSFNNFTSIENQNASITIEAEQESKLPGNENEDWNSEWTLLNNIEERSHE